MAEFATSMRFSHLPPAVVQLACRALADSLACAMAAASQPEIQSMAR
jgi:2-methylcitrate dehydratase PrpD